MPGIVMGSTAATNCQTSSFAAVVRRTAIAVTAALYYAAPTPIMGE